MAAYSPKGDPNISDVGAIVVTWVETGCAVLAVALRIWIRVKVDRLVDWDDYFVVFALVCLIAQSVLYTLVMSTIWKLMALFEGKMDPKSWPTFAADSTFYLKLQFAIILLFWTVLWSSKASFLAFYKNLFDRYQGWQNKGWWFVMMFTLLTYVTNWALQFTSCQPLGDYFLIGECNSSKDIRISNINLYVSTAFDIAVDLMIMVLPSSLLAGLKMNIKSKAGLATVFGSGFVVIAFAALRLGLNMPHGQVHVNPKWLALMTTTESSIAVIVACAPSFRRLLTERRHGSKLASSARQFYHPTDITTSEAKTVMTRSGTEHSLKSVPSRGSEVSSKPSILAGPFKPFRPFHPKQDSYGDTKVKHWAASNPPR